MTSVNDRERDDEVRIISRVALVRFLVVMGSSSEEERLEVRSGSDDRCEGSVV